MKLGIVDGDGSENVVCRAFLCFLVLSAKHRRYERDLGKKVRMRKNRP
jgi:hypothetical protein